MFMHCLCVSLHPLLACRDELKVAEKGVVEVKGGGGGGGGGAGEGGSQLASTSTSSTTTTGSSVTVVKTTTITAVSSSSQGKSTRFTIPITHYFLSFLFTLMFLQPQSVSGNPQQVGFYYTCFEALAISTVLPCILECIAECEPHLFTGKADILWILKPFLSPTNHGHITIDSTAKLPMIM